ncbi:MAG: hypothetical protein WCK24_02235 [Actinomycetes bacterium]
MDQQLVALFLTVSLASAVEMVEAATIVLAMGAVRGWRSALTGTVVALVTLGLIVLIAGPSILLVPIELLRLIVGVLLLIFGLQWLRKAILRSSGFKALHDEEKIFQQELAEAKQATRKKIFGEIDKYSFTLTFKTVLLEGFEVIFIVLTFGALKHSIATATLAAACALVVVAGSAIVIRKPLARVPENTLKFIVGIMAATFGIFWSTEGMGFTWPYADLMLLFIGAWVAALSYVCVLWLKRLRKINTEASLRKSKSNAASKSKPLQMFKTIVDFIKDFVVADEWITAVLLWGLVIAGTLVSLDSALWPIVLIYFTFVLPFGLHRSLSLRNS